MELVDRGSCSSFPTFFSPLSFFLSLFFALLRQNQDFNSVIESSIVDNNNKQIRTNERFLDKSCSQERKKKKKLSSYSFINKLISG